jgi:hypothetical protein
LWWLGLGVVGLGMLTGKNGAGVEGVGPTHEQEEHYQQAAATPLGNGHLSNLLGTSGLTEAGQQIIDGTLFNTHF